MPQGEELSDLKVVLTAIDSAEATIRAALEHIRDYGDLEHKANLLIILTESLDSLENSKKKTLLECYCHVCIHLEE